jgi:hypothetical protein
VSQAFESLPDRWQAVLWHAVVDVFGRPDNWSIDRPLG